MFERKRAIGRREMGGRGRNVRERGRGQVREGEIDGCRERDMGGIYTSINNRYIQ